MQSLSQSQPRTAPFEMRRTGPAVFGVSVLLRYGHASIRQQQTRGTRVLERLLELIKGNMMVQSDGTGQPKIVWRQRHRDARLGLRRCKQPIDDYKRVSYAGSKTSGGKKSNSGLPSLNTRHPLSGWIDSIW